MPAIPRRAFLAAAGAAVAAPRIRIAFLGAAHSHAHDKIFIVRDSPAWDLAGIVEDNPEIRAPYAQAGIPILQRDAVLKDSSIEVIAVESEVKQHAADGLAALDAGKHIHLEKPPAWRMEDMRRLVASARRGRRLVQMGYMWRHHPGLNKALEAARQGWLGDIYFVRGEMNTLIDADRRPEWNLFKGGQMFEQGGHLLDPIVRLLGRPWKVTPFLRSDGPYKDGLKDNTVAVLDYAKAMAVISSSVLQPDANRHRCFEFLGTNGTAVMRPIEPASLEIDLGKAAGPYIQGRQKVPLPEFRRHTADFDELARCVTQGRPLSVSLDEDLLLEEILLQASEMSS